MVILTTHCYIFHRDQVVDLVTKCNYDDYEKYTEKRVHGEGSVSGSD